MSAIIGSVLTAGGLVAVMLLSVLFRHPGAPRWAQTELAASLLAVMVTGVLGTGLGHLALVPRDFAVEGAGLIDIAALVGALAVLLVVWRALRPRLRMQPAATLSQRPEATVTELPTPPRTPRPRSGRPPRKAA